MTFDELPLHLPGARVEITFERCELESVRSRRSCIRALSGRLQFIVRRNKFNEDPLFSSFLHPVSRATRIWDGRSSIRMFRVHLAQNLDP